MRAIVCGAALLAGGCDAVFGISGDPGPCDQRSFATATGADITPADAFSISRDGSLAVIAFGGLPFELALSDVTPRPIDLGPYVPQSFAIAPDGDSLFYTAAIEPPTLLGALRSSGTWKLDAIVPKAAFVGTPSAEEFGPRRLLARPRLVDPQLQEYEDDGGIWTPHGELQKFDGFDAPNLTPSGLTMVYTGPDPATGEAAVFLASRPSMAEPFGAPAVILPGAHASPQLLDVCRQLYVIDRDNEGVLRRYDRP